MRKTHEYLPPELEEYLIDCEADRGTPCWFEEAFGAVALCAIDHCEYLAGEFFALFADEYGHQDNIDAAIQELKELVGLGGLDASNSDETNTIWDED